MDWQNDTDPLPISYKKIDKGFQWAERVEDAKNSISSNLTRTQYTNLTRKLLNSINDCHLAVEFLSDDILEGCHIPLTFYTIEGSLFVNNVLDDCLGIKPHDEVIGINGQHPMAYLQNFAESNLGNWQRDQVKFWGAHQLFHRERQWGPLPSKPVVMKLIPRDGKNIYVAKLCWREGKGQLPMYEDDTLTLIKPAWKAIEEPFELPGMTLQSFQTNDFQNIGFLRIYNFETLEIDYFKKFLEVFSQKIEEFNSKTELLVVDLRNNTGGDEHMANLIAQTLTEKNIELYPALSALNSDNVASARRDLQHSEKMLAIIASKKNNNLSPSMQDIKKSSIEAYTSDRDKDLNFIDSWQKNHTISSEYKPTKLMFSPKYHYQKPLVVLINESTISSAEILAALLQDFAGASIFGSNSVGGGGGNDPNFCDHEDLQGPYIISKLHFPTELSVRSTPNCEENFVVVPDVNCPMTLGDFTRKSPQYNAKLNDLIRSKMKNNNKL